MKIKERLTVDVSIEEDLADYMQLIDKTELSDMIVQLAMKKQEELEGSTKPVPSDDITKILDKLDTIQSMFNNQPVLSPPNKQEEDPFADMFGEMEDAVSSVVTVNASDDDDDWDPLEINVC